MCALTSPSGAWGRGWRAGLSWERKAQNPCPAPRHGNLSHHQSRSLLSLTHAHITLTQGCAASPCPPHLPFCSCLCFTSPSPDSCLSTERSSTPGLALLGVPSQRWVPQKPRASSQTQGSPAASSLQDPTSLMPSVQTVPGECPEIQIWQHPPLVRARFTRGLQQSLCASHAAADVSPWLTWRQAGAFTAQLINYHSGGVWRSLDKLMAARRIHSWAPRSC